MSNYKEAELAELVKNGQQPRHIAIIMDGNGRWAKGRGLPRFAGHKAGLDTVKKVVSECVRLKIDTLTLFAFSSENWKRPEKEVGLLMELFLTALKQEVKKLSRNNVKLKIIGGLDAFAPKLRRSIADAEALTAKNDGLNLVIAANYGGRWDIAQAAKKVAEDVNAGRMSIDDFNEGALEKYLCLNEFPEPDLFIRTADEKRISNFLLWQLAYTELYFTEVMWPDFDETEFQKALVSFAQRQRRFGRTGEQIEQVAGA